MLRRGLLGYVELRISKKLCNGAGLPIIYEAAEAPEIIPGSIVSALPRSTTPAEGLRIQVPCNSIMIISPLGTA